MENAIPIFLVGVMVILGILSLIAYNKVYKNGEGLETEEDKDI